MSPEIATPSPPADARGALGGWRVPRAKMMTLVTGRTDREGNVVLTAKAQQKLVKNGGKESGKPAKAGQEMRQVAQSRQYLQ